ncbi:MAG: SH3 domain-containing protein, partial [Chloroflexi bacterium]|nr:SH3 domain-containing protein [Chloroflexota bacterium]
PEPTPEPTPTGKWYRVTVTSLRVRGGPSTSSPQIGSIVLNEVVEEIGATSDRSWLQIRKQDGSLTGWSDSNYLTPAPAPTPPPEEEDANWYRVTASSLKIRSGPGIEYDAIGLFTLGELVEKLDASPNNEWLKVRSKDGKKIGWCFGEYLISVHNPAEEQPSGTPVDDHADKNWYSINTSTLNLREAPNLTAKIISTFVKNDVIPGVDESNTQWLKTEKLDGSIGWVSRDYLVQVSTASRPGSITQKLYSGATYLRKDLTSPRQVVVHVLAIDLKTLNLEFLVTPSGNNTDVLCTRVTSKFLEEFKLHAAINGGYFSYLETSSASAALCPNGGDPVRISDYAASRGKVYSPKKTAQPVIHINRKNQISFNKAPGAVFNAIAGDRMVVVDGNVVKNLAAQVPNPRTAIGINKNGRWLTFMVVDGRQPGFSEGVTFPELAELLISYGVHNGANMDGGGSSTMVIRGADGKARVLNSPIDMNQPGKERPVGNHLGLFIKT